MYNPNSYVTPNNTDIKSNRIWISKKKTLQYISSSIFLYNSKNSFTLFPKMVQCNKKKAICGLHNVCIHSNCMLCTFIYDADTVNTHAHTHTLHIIHFSLFSTAPGYKVMNKNTIMYG